MSVIDCTTFNGEYDLLEMRLNILDPYVDLFIIGEAELTFAGHAKELLLPKQQKRYERWFHKMLYSPILSHYEPKILDYMVAQCERDMSYPHRTAFYQKEHLQLAFKDAKDDDTIYFGDCDEIWTPYPVEEMPRRLRQLNYTIHLNRRSSEDWYGTTVATYAKVKEYGLNQIRLKAEPTTTIHGHHFTNMGGYEAVKKKLETYDHQEFNNPEYMDKLKERVESGQDFIGRPIKTWIDESQWPDYIKENRGLYQHLCG